MKTQTVILDGYYSYKKGIYKPKNGFTISYIGWWPFGLRITLVKKGENKDGI